MGQSESAEPAKPGDATPEAGSDLEVAFRKIDADKSGTLDKKEIGDAMRLMGKSDAEIGKAVAAMPVAELDLAGFKSLMETKAGHEAAAAAPAAAAAAAAKDDPKAAAQAAIVAKADQKMKEKESAAAAKASAAAPAAKAAGAASAAADGAASIAAEPKAKAAAKEKKPKGEGKGKEKKDKGTRICVKNLAEDMTQEQLKTLFEPFGAVAGVNVKNNEEGKCRGFAFVTLGSKEEADKAIAGMDKKDIGGKQLTVAMAESRPEGEKAEKGKGKDGKGKGKEGKGAVDGAKGKGKGQGKKGAAATPAAAQQAGYPAGYQAPYPYGQQYGYPGYPYNQQQQQAAYAQQMAAYAQQNPAYAQQMQAAQMAQMQAMVQGMYMQAVQQQQQQTRGGASPKAGGIPVGPIMSKDSIPVTAHAPNQEFVGILKTMSSRHGYGFIECEETKKLYERDVYVAVDLLPEGCKEASSAKLSFTVGVNKKGHPQARTCSLAQ